VIHRLVARLPVWVRTQPMDLLIVALCLQTGLVNLFGWGPTRPLEAAMPWWATRLWAVCLLAGSGCWLAGLTGIHERDGMLVATRLPVLLLGLRLLSLIMPVYFAAVAAIGGWQTLLPTWVLLLAAALIFVRYAELINRRGPA
jgi:hypothetical protein